MTAMGQSAGAHALACLMTVPSAGALFRRAILQSGQLGLGRSSVERADRVGGHVVEALDGADPATADVPTLLRAQRRAMVRAAGPGGLDSSPAFAPVDGVAPLAPGASWGDAARSGHDLIVGSTADEATTFVRVSPALWWMRRVPVLGRLVGLGAASVTRRVFEAPARRLADDAARAGSRVHHYRVDWAAPRPRSAPATASSCPSCSARARRGRTPRCSRAPTGTPTSRPSTPGCAPPGWPSCATATRAGHATSPGTVPARGSGRRGSQEGTRPPTTR